MAFPGMGCEAANARRPFHGDLGQVRRDRKIGDGVSEVAIQPSAFFRSVGAWAQTSFARSLASGLVVGILSILFYLSYAALIFSGPLTPWLSYGMAATFITGAIGGAAMSLCSSLPFAIGGPDGSTSAVTAALVTAPTGHMAAEDHPSDLAAG